MADRTVFPAFLQIRHEPNPAAEASFAAEIERATEGGLRRFREFSSEAKRLLDQAMTTGRNQFGSLDLGVADLKAAAAAQQARAIAAREVAQATALAAKEEGDYSRQARLAVAATAALAREEEEAARAALSHARAAEQVQERLNRQASATDLVTQATGRGTTAQRNVINSIRASRVAFVQLGQQMQDVVIQAQLGTNAMQIFTQQVPQAAFALSGLADSANKTQARIGRFATFLSGPWGAALFAATALLGPFIYRLISSGDEAEKSARSQRTLVQVLDDETSSLQEVITALDEYNRAQERSQVVTLRSLETQLAKIKANYQEAISIREALQAELERNRDFNPAAAGVPGYAGTTGNPAAAAAASALASNQAQVDRLSLALRNAGVQVANRRAEIATDPEKAIRDRFETLRQEASASITDVSELSAKLTELFRAENDALKAARARGNDRSAERAAAAAARLAEFGEDAEKKIANIRDRFIDIPPEVRKANEATRELDDIISDLERRKPTGFEQLVADAQELKAIIPDLGLDIAMRQMREESELQLEAERLILAGYEEEAEVLQIMRRLKEQFGPAAEREETAVRNIVEARAEELRTIERLRREQDAYLSATQSVRSEIEAIFAGRGSLANFGQIFRDLRAKVLTDQLFGDVLKDLDDSVKAQFGRAVDRLETDTGRAGRAAVTLADTFEAVAGRLSSSELIARTQFLEAPTIDPTKRPAIRNADGSYSTIETVSFATELGEVLIPTIVNGVRVSAEEAFDHFEATGEHLGIFATAEEAAAFARALSEAQGRLRSFSEAFSAEFWAGLNPNGSSRESDAIIVTARATERGIAGMTPEAYFEQMAQRVVGPLADELNAIFGTRFFSQLQGALGGALYGYATGGSVGGVLGGLKGLIDQTGLLGGEGGALSGALGKGLGGAQTGQMINGLASALGIKLSGTGSQIGGAIGAVLPIPGGDIIGALAGGILGKIIGGTKRGSALIGGTANGLGIFGYHGNSSSRESAAGTLAGSVIEAVNRIAEQLGASVNASVGRVSIGIRDDNYRVDRTGQGITKTKNGAIDFGQDAEAAIAFAVRDLINDGVITGLRQSTLRLLKAGNDIERAVQDALDFESVFKRLRRRKDPTGAALDELDAEFGRLKDLFTRAGASTAEWADLEELYWLERDEIIKEAMDRSLSAMRGFLDELTIGNTALSLRDRRQSAIAAYDPLAARVAAGDSSAYDDFVEASRALLDIERELFGSQSGYFERLEQVTNLTRGALNNGLPDFSDRDGPFGRHDYYNRDADIVAGISGTNTLLESQSARLDAVNENLGTIAALLARRGFGGALLASGTGW